jgi:predicted short-subunit dehydrogenase-like oxidoreductase (DUF2520 family)
VDVGIIGPGRVGIALGIAARRAGISRLLVAGSSEDAARAGAQRIGEGAQAVSVAEAAAADLIWLTVPDDSIASVAASLVAWLRPEAILVHCSGATSSQVLSVAGDPSGCAIAAAHPIQTFPTVSAAVADLPGSVWALEGDAVAMETLERFLAGIGSRTLRIDPGQKTRLHVAAVLACNYLVALLDAALELAGPAVGDRRQALEALLPLVDATVRNVATLGTERALTGPLLRGDVGTVRRHAQELSTAPRTLRDVYAALGAQALKLARHRDALDPATAQRLGDILRAISDGTEPPSGR